MMIIIDGGHVLRSESCIGFSCERFHSTRAGPRKASIVIAPVLELRDTWGVRLCLIVLLAGCGRIGFDATDAGRDGRGGDGGGDARCTSWSPFPAPVVDRQLSTTGSDDWAPRISADELSMLVDKFNDDDFDVALATRPTRDAAFTEPAPVAGVDTSINEQSGQLSRDGARMYVVHFASGVTRLWQYDRAGSAYAAALEHPAQTGLEHMWISDDELRAYWVERRGDAGAIVRATRADTGASFDAGAVVVELAHGRSGMTLALSRDERELVLSAPISAAGGDLELLTATRPDPEAAFGTLVALDELNTPADDVVGSLSPDGTTLYANLDTDTEGGRDADVWVTRRTCLAFDDGP